MLYVGTAALTLEGGCCEINTENHVELLASSLKRFCEKALGPSTGLVLNWLAFCLSLYVCDTHQGFPSGLCISQPLHNSQSPIVLILLRYVRLFSYSE